MEQTYDELKSQIAQLQSELESCRLQLQREREEHQQKIQERADGNRQLIQQAAPNEKLRRVLETAGTVCHDLNQPLMAVSGYCELIMMDVEDDQPIYRQLNKMKEQVDRMGVITRNLMDIIRREAPACL